MSVQLLVRNAQIVNEGNSQVTDLLVRNGRIEKIGSVADSPAKRIEVDASGLHLFPGVIDDQVHFREPGLTHKGDIFSESRAAAAGGITSYMEMPNTDPRCVTQELLREKFEIARRNSWVNYSFYIGATNDNGEELLKTDAKNVCGIKIFMGSSTGNMLVDNAQSLDFIFSRTPMLIATHCEDEHTIKENLEEAKVQFGNNIPPSAHRIIRNAEACYKSSSLAVLLAKKHGTRLHVLHISSEKELELFSNEKLTVNKKITAEACIHHLWFTDADYQKHGNFIKWNPAVKSLADREAIRKAVIDGRIDVIATDHAPHTIEEKMQDYLNSPSGGPLVQHSLIAMLTAVKQGWITLDQVVEKMCHAPADCFAIEERGYIREGYYADFVLADLNKPHKVTKENLFYKCGWSPFEGTEFSASIIQTYVNGNCVYDNGQFNRTDMVYPLTFNRMNY